MAAQASLHVVPPNETASQTKARLEAQKQEAIEKWKLRQPTLVPFLEVMDSHGSHRLAFV